MNYLDNLPSLNGLRSFVAAAECESFTRAAKILNVTPGAVIRLVRQFEDELGVPLFERTAHSIKLTPRGNNYFQLGKEALQLISKATDALQSSSGKNILRMNVPSTFALRWLMPRFPKFQEENPDLLVDISTKDGEVHYANEAIDVAVVYSDGKNQKTNQIFLMHEEMGVFCSPLLLKKIKKIGFTGLQEHCIIHNSTRPEAWEEYCNQYDISTTDLNKSPLFFEHFFMAIEAAVGSMGIALLPFYLVRNELADGRLVLAFKGTLKPKKSYYIEHPQGQESRKLTKIIAWLLQQIADEITYAQPNIKTESVML